MASLPLGLLRAAKGQTEALDPTGNPVQATKDLVGGVSQAATMPSSVFAPEAAEGAGAAVGDIVDAAGHLIPNSKAAGKLFEQVSSVVGDHPVTVTDDLSQALDRYKKLVENGNGPVSPLNKLYSRLTDPTKGDLSFDDARDFYQVLGKLTTNEQMATRPVMQRQVAQVWSALGDSIGQTAQRGGQLAKFQSAMKQYENLKTLQNLGEYVKNAAIKSLPPAAAYYGAKRLIQGDQP